MGEREPSNEIHQNSESILSQEFVEPILSQAKEYLRLKGCIDTSPLYLQLDNGELALVPLTLPETAEARQACFMALGLSLRHSGKGISEALFLSEVWYVEPQKDEGALDVAPSQHPQRKEAIVIMGRDAEGTRYTKVLQPFIRDSKGAPVFEPLAVAEYNLPAQEGHQMVGLVDHLFVSEVYGGKRTH